MNKNIPFIIASLFFCVNVLAAESDPLEATRKSLKDQIFVVETDSAIESESLNRISGQYDSGFSSPDQSYDSPDHHAAGPFAREKAEDKKNSSAQK